VKLGIFGESKMSESDLPAAELDVMTCLWAAKAATARQVREALAERRPLAHASVCTLLQRLQDKGLIAREKAASGKAFLYRPLLPPQKTHRHLVRDLLDRVFHGNGLALVTSLLESRPPTDRELDDLEHLLKDLREKQSKTARKTKKG
jgi:BlaI family transcriptional regulator, penicillinase repressor